MDERKKDNLSVQDVEGCSSREKAEKDFHINDSVYCIFDYNRNFLVK